MSADLHIHIYEGVEEKDMADFFSNTLGSKYFAPKPTGDIRKHTDPENSYKKISNTPDIWIGEVSWLKASLSEDAHNYVPNTIKAINEAIGEDLPILTDELIAKLCAAFDLSNDTDYDLTTADKVRSFLEEHRGKKVFTISW